MRINRMSDVLKGTDVLEETIKADGGWGASGSSLLLIRLTDHYNFVLNIFVSIRPYSFPEPGNHFQSFGKLVN